VRSTKEARGLLIDVARRRQRAGAGTPREVLLRRTADVRWPDLSEALGSIRWAVIGAVATRMYMPERATHDLDVAVWAEDAGEACRSLEQAGWRREGELAVGGTCWLAPSGQQVDIVEFSQPWAAQALEAAQGNRDPQGLPILPLPYLVLSKLLAGRVQDLADLSRMLGQADEPQLAAVRSAVNRYAPADADDVEALIELGRRELQ